VRHIIGWGEGMVERKRERPRELRDRNGVKDWERERGR
jgi:hypothetical protein